MRKDVRIYIYDLKKGKISRFDPKVDYNKEIIKVTVREHFIKDIENKKIKIAPNIKIQPIIINQDYGKIVIDMDVDTPKIQIVKRKKPNIDTKPTKGFSSNDCQ